MSDLKELTKLTLLAARIVMDDCQQYIEDWEDFLQKSRVSFKEKWNKMSQKTDLTTLSDFSIVRTIGTGSYGRVVLAKDKKCSDKFYAIKIMEKKRVLLHNQLQHCVDEKRILQSIDFHFIVKAEHFFKDNSYLYIVMPFISGGEMFTFLRKQRQFPLEVSKFYAAQVVLALEYFHCLQIVYRDLKPENLLIGGDGYLKIADLGFCKIVTTRTYTLCGTPEYIAPEVILSKGYGSAVDWWSLGVLIYEMCVGQSPFFCNDKLKMFKSIAAGCYNARPLDKPETKDVVKRLLHINPSKRLGNLSGGALAVKKHKWFAKIDWFQILNKKVPPPFKPQLMGPSDASFYEKYREQSLNIAKKAMFEKEFEDF